MWWQGSCNQHPTDLPLCCINCRKEHASNYVNCNHRRHLLGLNPLLDMLEMQPTIKKTSRNTGKKTSNKPKPSTSKEKPNTNQVVGLDGNQLLEAINRDNGKTPMRLWVSSALPKSNSTGAVKSSGKRPHQDGTLRMKHRLQTWKVS